MNYDFQTITYGRWPQGADGTVEPIQWRILSQEDDRILVLSEQILDMQPFNETTEPVHWYCCSLYKWLEEIFLQQAFTDVERERIFCNPSQDKTDSILFWQLGGLEVPTHTQGSIFLLGTEDVAQYFPNEDNAFCPGASAEASEYVKYQYSDFVDDIGFSWWLRSSLPGGPWDYIISPVDSVGVSIISNENRQGVRPAMWLKKK